MGLFKNGNADEILRFHHLKSTPQREVLLKVFIESQQALSLADINKSLKGLDRITLYRNLNSFEAKGLIHKIPDKEVPTYALCKHESLQHQHEDEHVHFKCSKCELTVCLDEVEIPKIKIPKQYKPTKYNYLIEGICANCAP